MTAVERSDPDVDAALFGAGPDLVGGDAFKAAARARAALDPEAAARLEDERLRAERREMLASDDDPVAYLRARAGMQPAQEPSDARLSATPAMSKERLMLAESALYQIAARIIGEPTTETWARARRAERWASVGHALAEFVQHRLSHLHELAPKDRLPTAHVRGNGAALDRRNRYGTAIQWTVQPGRAAELDVVEDLVAVGRALAAAFEGLPLYDARVLSPVQCELVLLLRAAWRKTPGEIAILLDERRSIGGVELGIVITPRQAGRIASFGAVRAYEYLRARSLVARDEHAERRREVDEENRERRESLGRDLIGWTEIARHLGKGERTARRYAAEHGMPVCRETSSTGTVTEASSAKIDEWFRTHGWNVVDEPEDESE